MEYLEAALMLLMSLTITAAFNGMLRVPKKKKEEEAKKAEDQSLIKKGIQALLKNDLKVRYDYWLEQGYAPDDARDDLEAEYRIYHSLGKNGVMDSRRQRFLALPSVTPRETEE
jgi:hypothetical protein